MLAHLVLATLLCQTKDLPAASARVQSWTFPSVFQAWEHVAENLRSSAVIASPLTGTDLQKEALNDLIWLPINDTGLNWDGQYPGIATTLTADSISAAQTWRTNLSQLNPTEVVLVEERYYDAPGTYFPSDSSYWLRDANGNRIYSSSGDGNYLIDYTNSDLQALIAKQCAALMQTGVVDGIMLDVWQEDAGRVSLIQAIRNAVGSNAIILVNTAGKIPTQTASWVNGVFLEGFGDWWTDWKQAASDLQWATTSLQSPQITALEGVGDRKNMPRMRFVTGLSLLYSNGSVLYGDPNSSSDSDHSHDWYPFWNKSLGRPTDAQPKTFPDGTVRREYANGTVVMNPPGNRVASVTFSAPRKSAASSLRSMAFVLNPGDADLYLK